MDPDANLDEQLSLARQILAKYDRDQAISSDDAGRLAELVIVLDEWIGTKGGFLPGRWQRDA